MNHGNTKGFTLIELLMVMGLMVLVTTIIVSGSFGMSRAASITSAQNIVYNSLQAARQRACIDGRSIFVVFSSNSFCIVEGMGVISDQNGNYFTDRQLNINGAHETKSRIWNLSNGAYAENVTIERDELEMPVPGTGKAFSYPVTKYTPKNNFNASQWEIGDAYGFEVSPPNNLPKGFLFGWNAENTVPDQDLLVFTHDGDVQHGSAKAGNNGNVSLSSGGVDIFIYEKIDKSHPIKISVNSAGKLVVEDSK